MKNHLFSFLFLAIAIVGCNKNNDDDNNNNSSNEFVKFRLNGILWNAKDGGSGYINTSTNTLAVTGSNDTATLAITIEDVNVSTGTYPLNGSTAPGLSLLLKTGSTPKNYSISSTKTKSKGSITVSALNPGPNNLTYIEGNFSGVAYFNDNDSIVITNGEFRQE